jgi:hypothetical protein
MSDTFTDVTSKYWSSRLVASFYRNFWRNYLSWIIGINLLFINKSELLTIKGQ